MSVDDKQDHLYLGDMGDFQRWTEIYVTLRCVFPMTVARKIMFDVVEHDCEKKLLSRHLQFPRASMLLVLFGSLKLRYST